MNGAVGVVKTILASLDGVPTVFTVRLSTGVLVIVHPIWIKKKCFLPCTYGYATTIRRAQGATYRHGCLWFDHTHPPERGYGYVGVSRFQFKDGVYLFGKIRRSDWQPVRQAKDYDLDEQYRGPQSESDYDSSEEHQMAAGEQYRRKNRRAMLEEYGEDPDDYTDVSGSEHSFCDAEAMEAWYELDDVFSLYRVSKPMFPIERDSDLLSAYQ